MLKLMAKKIYSYFHAKNICLSLNRMFWTIWCITVRIHRNKLKLKSRIIAQERQLHHILIDFSLTVKAATLIFISGHGSAIPSAKEGKSGFIYNLAK